MEEILGKELKQMIFEIRAELKFYNLKLLELADVDSNLIFTVRNLKNTKQELIYYLVEFTILVEPEDIVVKIIKDFKLLRKIKD